MIPYPSFSRDGFCIILGTSPILGAGFEGTPSFTDPTGDQAWGMGEDILKVWIANNESHLLVKIECAGPFSFEDYDFLYILLSVNDTTGITNLLGHTWNFTVDY